MLNPQPGEVFVDGTLGGAGHTRLLLKAGALVYGIDQNPYALSHLGELSGLSILQGNYRDMQALLLPHGVTQVDGVLLNIGVSSFQLNDAQRGFSYHTEAPLDMRMSQAGQSAYEVVNDTPTDELAAIIFEYGEERHSRRIARAIEAERQKAPIATTTQLAEIIKRAYPGGHARGIHPARRGFQAPAGSMSTMNSERCAADWTPPLSCSDREDGWPSSAFTAWKPHRQALPAQQGRL